VELARDRIRVNAICPGFIATPLAEAGRPDETRQRFTTAQPWPDFGRGEHIAGAALFLASDDAEFVTGEAMVVDGAHCGRAGAVEEISPHFRAGFPGEWHHQGQHRGAAGHSAVVAANASKNARQMPASFVNLACAHATNAAISS
jgi:hypothetical protein